MIINQIQGGRWDKFLRRLLPIKDRSVAPILASELVGQIVVQEWEPEFFWLRDDYLATGSARQSSVAAEISHCKLRNPDNSGNLVVLEELWIRTAADMLVDLAHSSVTIAGFVNQATAFRDLRKSALTAVDSTVGQVSINSDPVALGGGAIARLAIETLLSKEVKFPVILPPGSELIVRGLTVNVGLNVTFIWRERIAEPSELLE